MPHPYLRHLLEDIQNAHRKIEERSVPKNFEEEMEDLDRWIGGDSEQAFYYSTGLTKNNFPPSDQLSEEDMRTVLEAFLEMMETWNASTAFPNTMPVKERYEFLRNYMLEADYTPIRFGHIGMDFCLGPSEDCDWGSYCQCLDYKDED